MKDFFRLTWPKIIVALILPLYIGYVVQQVPAGEAGAIGPVFEDGWRISPLPFAVLLFGAIAVVLGSENFFSGFSDFTWYQSVGYFILEIVVPLGINYLVACGLVYLYRRIYARFKPNQSSPAEEGMDL
ncbi:MAG: hypothetical protein ACOYUK_04275 [Patescibacteria group bacterium]